MANTPPRPIIDKNALIPVSVVFTAAITFFSAFGWLSSQFATINERLQRIELLQAQRTEKVTELERAFKAHDHPELHGLWHDTDMERWATRLERALRDAGYTGEVPDPRN